MAKVSKEEVTEVTSSFRHTKITPAYRAIIDVNDQKTSRKDLLQQRYKEGIRARWVEEAETLFS